MNGTYIWSLRVWMWCNDGLLCGVIWHQICSLGLWLNRPCPVEVSVVTKAAVPTSSPSYNMATPFRAMYLLESYMEPFGI